MLQAAIPPSVRVRIHWPWGILAAVAAMMLVADAHGATFYIGPSGSNGNLGTSEGNPWGTFDFAFGQLDPGDTLLVLDGTYNINTRVQWTSGGGTSGNPVSIFAAPSATPILDFDGMTATWGSTAGRGIEIAEGVDWLHLKGLTIQNARDNGINSKSDNSKFEQLVTRWNGDSGLQLDGFSSNNLILNSDSYLNYDPSANGENADGFAIKFEDLGPGNVVRGSRAWGNSDDGWDMWESTLGGVLVEDSWAFDNGKLIQQFLDKDALEFGNLNPDGSNFNGDGTGFKLGQDGGEHILNRVLAWSNKGPGIDVNGNANGVTVNNSTSYNNRNNWQFDENLATHVLRNNVSLAGDDTTQPDIFFPAVNDAFNSWNPGIAVATAADFVTLIDTLARGPRQADGSLPVIDFLHLVLGSDLIDAGTNVGLPFNGSAPDLGAFEFDGDIWEDPVSGTWGTGSNWEDGSTPTDENSAFFDEAGTYTVTFNANPDAIRALTISAGNIIFTSSGGARTLEVNAAGGSQDVTISGGASVTLGTEGNPLQFDVGDQLSVEGGAALRVSDDGELNVDGDVLIGANGAGDSGQLRGAGTGIITQTLPGATLTVGSATGSSALLLVGDSSVVTTGTGETAVYASGTITIGNVFNVNGDLTIDGGSLTRQGGGTLNLTAGATVTVENGGTATFSSAYNTTGAANVIYNVTGTDSLFEVSSGSIGIRNGAEFNVSDGGQATSTNGIHVGDGSSGTLLVDGSGSNVTTSGQSKWGVSGGTATVTFSNDATGTFNGRIDMTGPGSPSGTTSNAIVESGAEVTVAGHITLAGAGASSTSATLDIQGSGSTLTQTGGNTITVGNATTGLGIINVGTAESGAQLTGGTNTTTILATGRINVGSASTTGTFDANGDVDVDGGQLNVRELGTFNLNGGKRLTVENFGSATFNGNYSAPAGADYTLSGNGEMYVEGDLSFGTAGSNTVTLDVGYVSSDGTITVGPDALVEGEGNLDSPNNFLTPTIIQGSVIGNSPAERINLNGYVTGVGTLENVRIYGTHAPGTSTAAVTVGDISYGHTSTLEIELGGTGAGQFDQVNSTGAVELQSSTVTLDVSLFGGYTPEQGHSFDILTAVGGITGQFTPPSLPGLDGDLEWHILYDTDVVSLFVTLPGDFNGDGVTDAADYTVWRDTLGDFVAEGTGADADFDGEITENDYTLWRENFGATAPMGGAAATAAVPEPDTLAMLFVGGILALVGRRGRPVLSLD